MKQSFISQIIEGDELYTKVHENKPVEDCEGWTIMLMERASRFIWAMSCGRKDEKLFLEAMEQLVLIIRHTQDTTADHALEFRLFSTFLADSSDRGEPPDISRLTQHRHEV